MLGIKATTMIEFKYETRSQKIGFMIIEHNEVEVFDSSYCMVGF
jgi:hypothetical protein